MEGCVPTEWGLGGVLWGGCLFCFVGRWSILLHIFGYIGPCQATSILLRQVGKFLGIQGVRQLGDHGVIWQYHIWYYLSRVGILGLGRWGSPHCRTNQIAGIWIEWGLLLQGLGVCWVLEGLFLSFFIEINVNEVDEQGGEKEGDSFIVVIKFWDEIGSSG